MQDIVKLTYFAKIILICLVLGTLTAISTMSYDVRGDGRFHFAKASGHYDSDALNFDAYSPLYHPIIGILTWDLFAFAFWNSVLVFILFPVCFWYFTGTRWALWFYVSGSVFAFKIMWYSFFPSATATILLLLFLRTNNIFARFLIAVAMALIHSRGYSLVALGAGALVLEWLLIKLRVRFFPLVLLSFEDLRWCISQFRVGTLGKISNWIDSVFPAFSIIGFLQLLKDNKVSYLIIILVSFLMSMEETRYFFPAIFLLLGSFINFFIKLSKRQKVILLVCSLLNLAYTLYYYNYIGGFA